MKQAQHEQENPEQESPEQEIKRISFSEFKNWKECSYRHHLIYVKKIPYFSTNEYTAFGTAMHTSCEQIMLGEECDPYQVFQEKFLEELKDIKEEKQKLNKDLILEMREQAKVICTQILPEVQKYFGDFELISVEEELLEPISEFESYGKSFKGFIDLVIKTPDDKYHIIDWKTCSWGWNSAKKSDPIVNYQLTYYKNYFAKKHNIESSKIEAYFILLKRTAKKNNVEVVPITSGHKKVENSLKLLENAVINIERKNYIKNRLNCKYCKFYRTENCK